MGTSRSLFQERAPQYLGVEQPAVEGFPRGRAGEPDLGGAEEHLVDLVKVSVVFLERLVERRAVVVRRRRRKLRGEIGELIVGRIDEIGCLAAVEDAVCLLYTSPSP